MAAATDAMAASVTGRRAVSTSNRSSPGHGPPERAAGASATELRRTAPAASMAVATSGSSASIAWRQRARNEWSMWNWLTPRRSQACHEAAGGTGGGAGSRSSTRTRCPSRASSIPALSPLTPPPITITSACTSA